jgi:hypothetical protein
MGYSIVGVPYWTPHCRRSSAAEFHCYPTQMPSQNAAGTRGWVASFANVCGRVPAHTRIPAHNPARIPLSGLPLGSCLACACGSFVLGCAAPSRNQNLKPNRLKPNWNATVSACPLLLDAAAPCCGCACCGCGPCPRPTQLTCTSLNARTRIRNTHGTHTEHAS